MEGASSLTISHTLHSAFGNIKKMIVSTKQKQNVKLENWNKVSTVCVSSDNTLRNSEIDEINALTKSKEGHIHEYQSYFLRKWGLRPNKQPDSRHAMRYK